MSSETVGEITPGVSVIVPLYNRERYIRTCLDSILAQERDFPMEIVVADDGSQDAGPDVVRSYGEPVRFIPKPDGCTAQGPGPTRNRAIAAARYDRFAFVDSDDAFLPGHLLRLYEALDEHPEAAFVVDRLTGFASDPARHWLMPYPVTETATLETVFLNPYISLGGMLLRRSAVDEIFGPGDEPFDENLLLAEDVDFFLRILERHPEAPIIEWPGLAIREHGDRSILDRRKAYRYAEAAMRKAVDRHPYPAPLVRKRTAVILFRYAQADFSDGKYFSGLCRLFRAFLLDPGRGLRLLLRTPPREP